MPLLASPSCLRHGLFPTAEVTLGAREFTDLLDP